MAPTNDKVQEYFASMNSLSARISADIRAVEETVLNGNSNQETTSKLTYNEKCAAIDKYLIDDVIEKNAKISGGRIPKIKCKPNAATTNHLHSLIQAMYPPKPEKYVFEEAGGVWLDEHSGPFSFCKQSQVKCCPLGKNVLQNLAETEPADVRRHHTSKNAADKKRQKPDMRNKVPQQPDNQSKRNSQEIVEIQPQRSGAGRGIFGVNVMDFTGSGQVKSTKLSTMKPQEKRDEDELQEELEDKLPQQKQNLQLIAELQAKLKRNNPKEESNVDPGNEPKELEISQQQPQPHVPKNVTETKEAKTKAKKVKKPKAPPPPPPPVASKVEADCSGANEEFVGKTSGSSFGKHQKAVADQLRSVMAGVKLLKHSRKNSNPPRPPAPQALMVASAEIPSSSKAPLQRQPSKPKPEIPRSQSKGDTKVESKPAAGRAEGGQGGPGQEFCVDVSSPCRIATPKTGLDFLDNW